MTGVGLIESPLLLIYDIVEDRARFKLSELCLDFGLERIQYSAFAGRLNRNRREELCLKVAALLEKEKGNGCVRVQPICDRDFKEAWETEFEHADEARPGGVPPSAGPAATGRDSPAGTGRDPNG